MSTATTLQASNLKGAFTPLITPIIKGSEEIDWYKLALLIEDQIAAGIDGLVACGTTGQSATLRHDEHAEVCLFIYQKVAGRVPVIFSAGSNCTREALALCHAIEHKVGPATFLHVTGYYNVPPQNGLLTHFTRLADKIDAGSNIILYNVPTRTVCNLEPATVIELAQHPKIIGIKQATDKIEETKTIIAGTQDLDFTVLSGEDKLVAAVMELGGTGVISATANVAPRPMKKITQAALAGDFGTAFIIQQRLLSLIQAVFLIRNPIPLAQMFNTDVRLPLKLEPKIEKLLQEILSHYTAEELGIDLAKYA